jgi:hypothetical protein
MFEYNIPDLESAAEFFESDCRGFYEQPIFRGQQEEQWKLRANLFRPDALLPPTVTDHFLNWCKGSPLLAAFNVETLLQVAQHYGLKTDLLDFSKDPLVACYFALGSEPNTDKGRPTKVAVFVVDAKMLDNIESLASPLIKSARTDILAKYHGMYREGQTIGLSRLENQKGVFARDAHGTLDDVLNSINDHLGLEYEERFHERLSYIKAVINPSSLDHEFLARRGITREFLFPKPNDLEREFERFLTEYPDPAVAAILGAGLTQRS